MKRKTRQQDKIEEEEQLKVDYKENLDSVFGQRLILISAKIINTENHRLAHNPFWFHLLEEC